MLDKATNIEVNFTIGSHIKVAGNMDSVWKHDIIIQWLKKLIGVKLSANWKGWYVPDNNTKLMI